MVITVELFLVGHLLALPAAHIIMLTFCGACSALVAFIGRLLAHLAARLVNSEHAVVFPVARLEALAPSYYLAI